MSRYAANLLLVYVVEQVPKRRQLCEKRIVVFEASGAHDAVRRAKRHGKRAEFSYRNADGQTARIQFLGLVDVISLEACEENEAYFSLRHLSNPKRHVRPDGRLSVLASHSQMIGSSWWAVPKSLVHVNRRQKHRRRA